MVEVKGLEIVDISKIPDDKEKITDKDLEDMVNGYDPKNDHQAPVVVGHPETDSPSFGWVERLYKQGTKIFADISMLPEFVELLKKGVYKKRSIAFYIKHKIKKLDDKVGFYLRHLGWLGAAAPAVEGMKDLKLSDKEKFEIYEEEIEIKKKEKEDLMITYTQEQVTELVEAKTLQIKNDLKLEYDEKVTLVESEKTELKKDFDKLKADNDKQVKEFSELKKTVTEKEIEVVTEKLLKEGKLIPAQHEDTKKLLLELAEKDENLYEAMKKNLESGGKQVEFKETKNTKGEKDNGEDAELKEVMAKCGLSKEDAEKYGDMNEYVFTNDGGE